MQLHCLCFMPAFEHINHDAIPINVTCSRQVWPERSPKERLCCVSSTGTKRIFKALISSDLNKYTESECQVC